MSGTFDNHRIGPVRLVLGLLLSLPAAGAASAATLRPGDLVVSAFSGPSNTAGIFRIDPTTGTAEAIVTGGLLVDPYQFALDAAGNILVADRQTVPAGAIVRINPTTGEQSIVTSGGLLRGSNGLAIGSSGDIFVTRGYVGGNSLAGIVRIDPLTGVQTILSEGGSLLGPQYLDFDGAGRLLVSDYGSPPSGGAQVSSILAIDPVSGAQSTISTRGVMTSPFGLAIAPDGTIISTGLNYLANYPVGSLFQIDPTTGEQTLFAPGGAYSHYAYDVAIGAEGQYYVVGREQSGLGNITRVDPVSGAQALVVLGGTGAGQIRNPRAILVVPSIAAVPEPGSLAMVAVGGVVISVLAGARRRAPRA